MQVVITNLSATDPVYVSSATVSIPASGSITLTKRSFAQVDADTQLKTLINAGSVSIAYTEEAGDDITGLGGLNTGVGTALTFLKVFAAGAGGAADDVAVFTPNLVPFALIITDVTIIVSTLVGGSTCTLRDTAGGAGAALSDALATATTGVKRNAAATTTPAVARNGTVFLRRSDSGVAGTLLISMLRTA
jgi:hypothetical protein